MKVLSLFDGMSCGNIAFRQAGIPVERYVAYEIDKYAIQSAVHNFPLIEERGDVFEADFTPYKGFDFVIGGSPCTYWSVARTSGGREVTASGLGWELFSQYVRAIKEVQPRWFIYENNRSMSDQIRASITEAFGFEPICINSALVSAQNRQRLYWVGRRNDDGTYNKVHVEQPADMGILLRDILEKGEPVNVTAENKAHTLRASCYKDGIRNLVANNIDRRTCVAEPVCVAQRGRYVDENGNQIPSKGTVQQFFEARPDGKTNTLTTVQKDNYAAVPVSVDDETSCYAKAIEYKDGRPIKAISTTDGKVYDVYEVKDGKINVKGALYSIRLPNGFFIVRKLTITECKRLQTVPEDYEFPVSNTRALQQLGNGWTCLIICHLLLATQNAT